VNRRHRRYCAGDEWASYVRTDVVPPVVDGLDLGDDVLELGPGPGLTTDLLQSRVPRLTAIEIDDQLAGKLRARMTADHVEIVHGDASSMPFPDGRFSAVLCFTMLHHVPTDELQDRLFAEARRVLRPGGIFTGSDSCTRSLRFRLFHLRDTLNLLDPDTLGARLESAGFSAVHVSRRPEQVLFRAVAGDPSRTAPWLP
jgi:SAM-dependent methyltransferase